MTSGDDTVTAGTQPDGTAVIRILRRLARAHPGFTFSREPFGWKGCRWVAERTDRKAPGLRVVITDDLMEMHKALRYHIEAAEQEDEQEVST